ncbi:hypothetical protein [Mobilicoccus caccae]|uniref:Uncharacterized protein n=1 Tax=Mobilicoccus caccae TaxID=1859295 RepID=A0ABQ6IS08_9MICO|nr:hypothetical protein [Mobilicoccus caccae]GMA40249.1 hypothetical protein GCM10025883_22940 [Mobilicoccus caccae]
MRIRSTLGVAALTLALAGCATGGGSGTSTAISAPVPATAQTAPAASPTTGTAGHSANEATPTPGATFTAVGDTPHWRAVVNDGVLTTEGAGVGERRVTVVGAAWAKGVEFTGTDRGSSISLIIRAGHCAGADGKDTGQKAELVAGNRMLRGCAVPGVAPATGA